MAKKVYDTVKVVYLYKKYGSLTAVRMRLGYATTIIKKILLENGVELNKHVPKRWDINLSRK